MDLIVKRCLKCGAVVEALDDCNCKDCGITCCGQKMVECRPNSVDASFEKHVPTYTIKCRKLLAKVNHVMEDEHYIEWIALVADNTLYRQHFKAGQVPEAEFPYIKGSKLYAYCNKHGLWIRDVD